MKGEGGKERETRDKGKNEGRIKGKEGRKKRRINIRKDKKRRGIK